VELPRDYTLKSHWPDCSGMVAGFESEWWPDSNRNGGRIRVGTVAAFPSESWPDSSGIRSQGQDPDISGAITYRRSL